MSESADAFPALRDFLGYMSEDWDLFGDTLEAVVAYYVKGGSPEDARMVEADIKRFIDAKGNDLDQEYQRLFPDAAWPSGWNMTTRDWLLWIERLAGEERRKRAPEAD
jgi:hypothetical protein